MFVRGTWWWVGPPFVMGFAVAPLWPLASVACALLAAFLLLFHRDPPRAVQGPWVLAADGRILRVDELDDGGHRVVTFLSPFDLHVVRAPCDGTVVSVERVGRGHRPAFHKDADHNEGRVVTLATDRGDVAVSMLVGLVARRARPWVSEGDQVKAGQRIGMIHLGSRVDVDLPASLVVKVAPGDRALSGAPLADATDRKP